MINFRNPYYKGIRLTQSYLRNMCQSLVRHSLHIVVLCYFGKENKRVGLRLQNDKYPKAVQETNLRE